MGRHEKADERHGRVAEQRLGCHEKDIYDMAPGNGNEDTDELWVKIGF